MYKTVLYETEIGNAPLRKFLKDLIKKDHNGRAIAQIKSSRKRLEQYGFDINKYCPESIKQIRDDIYELRSGDNRVLFFYYDDNGTFVLLHGFKKKTNTTPKQEIDLAEKECKDYIRRNKHG